MHPDQPTPPEEMFSLANLIEDLGFDSLWMGDHIAFHGGYFTEILTTLAALSARSDHLILGTAIYLLPLRIPGVAAKAAATVDYLTGGGRFIFGVGVGGEGKEEFDLCGIPIKERGARTDEAIEILRKLWSGKSIRHEGQFWRFGDTRQNPPPATPGGPPIWIGGRSDAARKRAALLGDGYISYLFTAERFRQGLEQMQEIASRAGRELRVSEGRWTPAHHAFICIDEDETRALNTGTDYLSRRYNMDFHGIAEKYLVHGSPFRCAEQLEEFISAGVTHFILRPTGPPSSDADQLVLLAEKVIPQVKK